MFWNKQRLGIDLGTANTIIYIEKKGIALREPSIVAKQIETGEIGLPVTENNLSLPCGIYGKVTKH